MARKGSFIIALSDQKSADTETCQNSQYSGIVVYHEFCFYKCNFTIMILVHNGLPQAGGEKNILVWKVFGNLSLKCD